MQDARTADALWRLDATDLAALLRTGQVSAREATHSVLARMDAVNPRLNAVVQRFDAEALAAADAADAARAQGAPLAPLHGVPVTVKVNVDQRGHATTNGVVAFRDAQAQQDSPVVANLRAAGAIIVGRTNTPAFSMRVITANDLHGRTRNPLDPAITPGGSSGGAGAAVAAGIGPIAHGNDIAGSIRMPAYCNGIVGLRVGLGRIPSFNPSQLAAPPIGAQLMAVQGPLTRSVRDARLAFAAMARGDARDTRWADVPLRGAPPPPPIRVALIPELPGGFTHPAQAAAVRTAGRHLAAAGYAVAETLPPDIEAVITIWHDIASADLLALLAPAMQQYGDDAGRASLSAWLQLVPPKGLREVLAALARRDLLLRRWQEFFIDTPLVVMPTMADLPPEQDADITLEGQRRVLDSMRASLIAPALGLCGLAVPVGRHGALRTGVQISAARFREDLALDAGAVIEAAEGVVVPVDPGF